MFDILIIEGKKQAAEKVVNVRKGRTFAPSVEFPLFRIPSSLQAGFKLMGELKLGSNQSESVFLLSD